MPWNPVHDQSVIYGARGIAPGGFAVCLQLLLVSEEVLLSAGAEWWLQICSINRSGRNLRLILALRGRSCVINAVHL